MDAEQLKEDVRAGRIAPERLVHLIVALQRQLQEANRRIAELEKKLGGGSGPATVTEPFSLRAEEQRQRARGKKTGKRKRPMRRGRISTAEKIAQAKRREKVFPEGLAEVDCTLSHTRPVWRLENGQAILVAYEIYRGPKTQYGKIPGVLGRSEYGIEVLVTISHLVFVVGLSLDLVCLLLNFIRGTGKASLTSCARCWRIRQWFTQMKQAGV